MSLRPTDPSHARRCLELNDLDGAMRCAELAIAARAPAAEEAELRLIQAEVHFWRAQYAQAEARAMAALARLAPGSRPWFAGMGELVAATGRRGLYVRVEELVEAIDAAPPRDDVEGAQVACLHRAVSFLVEGGRPELARAILERGEAVPAIVARLDAVGAAWVHEARSRRALHEGDLGAALADAQKALECFDRAGDSRRACSARVDLGFLYAELGVYGRAAGELRRAEAEALKLRLDGVVARARLHLAPVLLQRDLAEEARTAAEDAATRFHRQLDQRGTGLSLCTLSTVLLAGGRAADALAMAGQAVEALRDIPPALAGALGAAARARFALGEPLRAVEVAREGMRILASLEGIEACEARLRLVYAEALAAVGDHVAAAAALEAARRRVLDRAARIAHFWWRDGFLRHVPENRATLDLAERWATPPAMSA